MASFRLIWARPTSRQSLNYYKPRLQPMCQPHPLSPLFVWSHPGGCHQPIDLYMLTRRRYKRWGQIETRSDESDDRQQYRLVKDNYCWWLFFFPHLPLPPSWTKRTTSRPSSDKNNGCSSFCCWLQCVVLLLCLYQMSCSSLMMWS